MLNILAKVKSLKLDYNDKKTGEGTITLTEITLSDDQLREIDALTKIDDYVCVSFQEKDDLFSHKK